MKHKRNLIVGLFLTTVTAMAVLTTVSAPDVETSTTYEEASIPQSGEVPDVVTEVSPSTQGSCGYQWAYKNAPELTEFFDAAVKALNLEASGRVEYFGEDCIYADGTSTFLPMETDFYIRLHVDDLSKEEDFGNWVAQVMQVVTQIPREELPGNYGFVEFWFEKSETEHIVFRVPIQQYINEAQGKSGTELLSLFYSPP